MWPKKDMIDNIGRGKGISIISEGLAEGHIDNEHENCEGLNEAIRRGYSSKHKNENADNFVEVPWLSNIEDEEFQEFFF